MVSGDGYQENELVWPERDFGVILILRSKLGSEEQNYSRTCNKVDGCKDFSSPTYQVYLMLLLLQESTC